MSGGDKESLLSSGQTNTRYDEDGYEAHEVSFCCRCCRDIHKRQTGCCQYSLCCCCLDETGKSRNHSADPNTLYKDLVLQPTPRAENGCLLVLLFLIAFLLWSMSQTIAQSVSHEKNGWMVFTANLILLIIIFAILIWYLYFKRSSSSSTLSPTTLILPLADLSSTFNKQQQPPLPPPLVPAHTLPPPPPKALSAVSLIALPPPPPPATSTTAVVAVAIAEPVPAAQTESRTSSSLFSLCQPKADPLGTEMITMVSSSSSSMTLPPTDTKKKQDTQQKQQQQPPPKRSLKRTASTTTTTSVKTSSANKTNNNNTNNSSVPSYLFVSNTPKK